MKPPTREADGTSQEVSDRGELVGGYKHDAAERPEEGPEDGVRRRPADVEQEVLSDLVGREVSGSPVVNVRRSTVRTRRHLLRVHRYERPAHPDTVCAAEHADKDEQRNVDPEERLDHTRFVAGRLVPSGAIVDRPVHRVTRRKPTALAVGGIRHSPQHTTSDSNLTPHYQP